MNNLWVRRLNTDRHLKNVLSHIAESQRPTTILTFSLHVCKEMRQQRQDDVFHHANQQITGLILSRHFSLYLSIFTTHNVI